MDIKEELAVCGERTITRRTQPGRRQRHDVLCRSHPSSRPAWLKGTFSSSQEETKIRILASTKHTLADGQIWFETFDEPISIYLCIFFFFNWSFSPLFRFKWWEERINCIPLLPLNGQDIAKPMQWIASRYSYLLMSLLMRRCSSIELEVNFFSSKWQLKAWAISCTCEIERASSIARARPAERRPLCWKRRVAERKRSQNMWAVCFHANCYSGDCP